MYIRNFRSILLYACEQNVIIGSILLYFFCISTFNVNPATTKNVKLHISNIIVLIIIENKTIIVENNDARINKKINKHMLNISFEQ